MDIERTEFGYVQRSTWKNVDRIHEEVVELDSPYSLRVAAGTHVRLHVLVIISTLSFLAL